MLKEMFHSGFAGCVPAKFIANATREACDLFRGKW